MYKVKQECSQREDFVLYKQREGIATRRILISIGVYYSESVCWRVKQSSREMEALARLNSGLVCRRRLPSH